MNRNGGNSYLATKDFNVCWDLDFNSRAAVLQVIEVFDNKRDFTILSFPALEQV